MQQLRLGDSLDKGIDMGAVVDESQMKGIENYVQSARKEGAEVRPNFLYSSSTKDLFLF